MRGITLLLLVVVVLFPAGCADLPMEEEQTDNTKPVSHLRITRVNPSIFQGVVKQTIQLDGSGSSDADGDPLTYNWSITSAPDGSTASLSDTATMNPTFTPDVAGVYTIQLVVNDGVENSDADSILLGAETPDIQNSMNVFWCSFLEDSTITLASGESYWIRMSIGFEGDNGYNEAGADYENISFSVTLNGTDLELYGSTRIEYNHGVGFWEINGYYHSGTLEKGTYEIVATTYRGGNYFGTVTFFIIAV